jgi:predicted NBD/HSP70 family sugar kinase
VGRRSGLGARGNVGRRGAREVLGVFSRDVAGDASARAELAQQRRLDATLRDAARQGDPVARLVVADETRRIALHVAPIAAVADVELVILGGGIGANADLLLDPIRRLLAAWLPYPPRLEVSSLGEAAVLTGALSLGLSAALENVLVNARGGRVG